MTTTKRERRNLHRAFNRANALGLERKSSNVNKERLAMLNDHGVLVTLGASDRRRPYSRKYQSAQRYVAMTEQTSQTPEGHT